MARYAFQMISPIKDGKMSQMANPSSANLKKWLLSTMPFGPKCHRLQQKHQFSQSHPTIIPNQPFVKQIKHWSGIVRNLS